MRYLQYRNEFLIKKIQLDESQMSNLYNGSRLVRETFESDITWGGSLIGRFLNSTVRVFKIGYKSMKVGSQINNLKKQLDYLVTQSMTGEAKEKLDLLQLKVFLEEIKDLSLRPSKNKSDEEKILESILGTPPRGNVKDWFDPNAPKKNVKTDGPLQNILDSIINNYPDLKEILGIDREVIIDTISDFSDELRVYAYELANGPGSAGGKRTSAASSMVFRRNFGNVIDAIREVEKEREENR